MALIKIKQARYEISSPDLKRCPNLNNMPEIAMIGRSNVGKSSLINTLTNRKNLARTSNTPGKTRLINYYVINDEFSLVDLPGYGFANTKKTEQQKWQKNFEEFLLERKEIQAVIQIIDSRHCVQNNDFQMREWLEYNNIPIITIASKIDNLKKNAISKSLNSIAAELDCDVIGFSAKNRIGRENVLAAIGEYL